jgi:CubicO group peptidase (beta-lactamase class C family)
MLPNEQPTSADPWKSSRRWKGVQGARVSVLWAISLVCQLTGGTACTGAHPKPTHLTTEEEISDLAQRFFEQHGLASLEVAAFANGKIVFAHGYGEWRPGSGQPPDLQTPYGIASITKVFTGLALEQLKESGKLSFDDPLARWIPEALGVTYPTNEHPTIRLNDLVTHRTGMPIQGKGMPPGTDEAQLISQLHGLNLQLTPETDYLYSNYAMSLAGIVIERASGEAYIPYVQQHILSPLGMDHTGFEPIPTVAAAFANGKMIDHRSAADGTVACGGMFSTAADMMRFAAFELSAWPPRDEQDPGTVLTRIALRETQAQRSSRTGINWFCRSNADGALQIDHTGKYEGHESQLVLLPRLGIAVIMLLATRDQVIYKYGLAEDIALVISHDTNLRVSQPSNSGAAR